MKKILTLLVMFFFMTSVMVANVSALDKPLDETWIPSGDDHPWGGDGGGGGGDARAIDPDYEPITYSVSYSLINDLIVKFYRTTIFKTFTSTTVSKQDVMYQPLSSSVRVPYLSSKFIFDRKGIQK